MTLGVFLGIFFVHFLLDAPMHSGKMYMLPSLSSWTIMNHTKNSFQNCLVYFSKYIFPSHTVCINVVLYVRKEISFSNCL